LDAEYHSVMADLTNRKVSIIVAANVAATVAAAKATNTIPVVMLAVNDPVGVGAVHIPLVDLSELLSSGL